MLLFQKPKTKKSSTDFTAPTPLARAFLAYKLRKGKKDEERQCINFFIIGDDELNAERNKGCSNQINVAIANLIFGKKEVWSVSQYLTHVQNLVDKLDLKQRAIEKIGLDESQISEIPPVVISSFKKGSPFYWYKDSAKKIYLTDKFCVTWIFFSDTQIYTYTYELNTISEDVTETTNDFFYSDITCITTSHEIEDDMKIVRGHGCIGFFKKKYVRNNIHWDALKITVPSDDYYFHCKTTPTTEQSIQAAKAMIREKKHAI